MSENKYQVRPQTNKYNRRNKPHWRSGSSSMVRPSPQSRRFSLGLDRSQVKGKHRRRRQSRKERLRTRVYALRLTRRSRRRHQKLTLKSRLRLRCRRTAVAACYYARRLADRFLSKLSRKRLRNRRVSARGLRRLHRAYLRTRLRKQNHNTTKGYQKRLLALAQKTGGERIRRYKRSRLDAHRFALRRVRVAQRAISHAKAQRVLRKRRKRLRLRTRFRYRGLFGKRRRRVERRDRALIFRHVTKATRKRAVRTHTRRAFTAVQRATLKIRTAYSTTLSQTLFAARAAVDTRRRTLVLGALKRRAYLAQLTRVQRFYRYARITRQLRPAFNRDMRVEDARLAKERNITMFKARPKRVSLLNARKSKVRRFYFPKRATTPFARLETLPAPRLRRALRLPHRITGRYAVILPFKPFLRTKATAKRIGPAPWFRRREGRRRYRRTLKRNIKRHRRLFAKWRRLVLRRFRSLSASRRRSRRLRLDLRASLSHRGVSALPALRRNARGYLPTTPTNTLRWARSRAQITYRVRRLKGETIAPTRKRVYTTPVTTLRALRVSRYRQGGGSFHTALSFTPNTSSVTHVTAAIFARRQGAPSFANAALAKRRAALSLIMRTRRQIEGRIYRRQFKLRLPRTQVSRRKLRHGGRKLFTRNTLKTPTSWVGKRNQLLLPRAAWIVGGYDARVFAPVTPFDPRPVEGWENKLPRAWKRPANFINSLRAHRLREHRRFRAKRKKYYSARRAARRVHRPRASKLPRLRARLIAVDAAISTLTAGKRSAATALALLKLRTYQERLKRRIRLDADLIQDRTAPLLVTGVLKRLVLKKERASSVPSAHTSAAGQVQSARSMLKAERGMSAWSPLYPLKWRRWRSPRREGVPYPRTWVSNRMRRDRVLLNESLAYRGLPERRYIDFGYAHLQYYRGSAPSVGYERFRRSYRPRSEHNRWWKPVNYPVPFANPYSRRALNSTKYMNKRFEMERLYRIGERGTEARALKGEYYPIRYPSTTIPWRNYHYRKPKRRAAPYKIQRWTKKVTTFAARQSDKRRHAIVTRRSKHAVRRLEKLFPQTAIWAGRRWESLDSTTATTAESRLLDSTLRRIPLSVWGLLRRSARTAEKYAALRQNILAHFRRWSRYALPVNSHGELVSLEHQNRATEYLREYIASVTTELVSSKSVAFGRQFTAKQTYELEHKHYARQVQNKKDRFWTKRLLPRVGKECTSDTYKLLARENVPLYKRWLHGAERYLRHSQSSHLATAHGHNEKKVAVNLGRRRQRFPASGRRRTSYDSMLHAFAKRTSPARFRRTSTIRFQALRSKVTDDFKANQTVYEQSRTLNRRRRLSRQLGRVAYLSPTWRELLAYRSNSPVAVVSGAAPGPTDTSVRTFANVNVAYPLQYGQPLTGATKRRFASLPVNTNHKQKQAQTRLFRAANADQLRALRMELLRFALRRRRTERTIFDLKKLVQSRRLPREQVLPPWRTRKSARRRSRYAAAGDWGMLALKRRPASTLFWTLHHLGTASPRMENCAKTGLAGMYYAETLRLPAATSPKVTRKNWARLGFNINPKLRRTRRRRKADSHLRQRRRRRYGATFQSLRRFNHWSERPQLRRLSRGTVGRIEPQLTCFARRLARSVRAFRSGQAVAASKAQVGLLNSAKSPHYRLLARLSWQSRLLATQERARKLAAIGTPVTAKELFLATSLRCRGKVRRLIRTAIKQRSKLRALQAAAYRRAVKKQKQYAVAAEALAETAHHTGRRFVDQPIVFTTVTPLFFQNRTKTIVKTEATLERERLADIASKEARYKVTAQYAEGLTTFIPALINQMISRRMEAQKYTRRNVKRLISSIYWSLRVYLNVDPFDARFYLRDGNYAFRSSIEQEMLVRAKDQNTDQPQRAALRRRFQPGRLHLAPNTDRFRFDWLRTFFPLKHSLFQEDPDDYGNLPIATSRLRRLIPSGFGIDNWRTARVTPSLETRSRKILTLKYSRPMPRVETMLQETRRLPEAEQLVLGATKIGAVTRGSFFSRPFSSYTHRATALLGKLIYQRKRFDSVDEDSAPTFIAVTSRYRVKPRIEARGRTNFSFNSKGTMVGGALDPRFLRYKSPRSRQYTLRLPQSVVTAAPDEKRTKLATYRELRQNRVTPRSVSWTRHSRRSFFGSFDAPADATAVEAALSTTRGETPTRRIPAYLDARKQLTRRRLAHEEYNTFISRYKRLRWNASTQYRRKQARQLNHHRILGHLSREQAAVNLRQRFDPRYGVENTRSVLQYRIPAHRNPRIEYKTERVLSAAALELKPQAARHARAWSRLFWAQKVWTSGYERIKNVTKATKLGEMSKISLPLDPEDPKNRLAILRARLGRYRKVHLLRSELRRKFTVTPGYGARFGVATHRLNLAPLEKARTGVHFFVRVGGHISAHAGMSKEALLIEERRRQTPFEVFRPKLWFKLTNRWKKRQRTMRFWLKDTKRWLRDPWLSEIVSCRPKIKGKRPEGELALIEQQIGQYVAEVDDRGVDIPEDKALFREREEFVPSKTVEAPIKPVKKGPRRQLALQRRVVSLEARRKPVPTMWLANHEYRGVLKEVEENLAKTPAQLLEEEQAKVKEYWRRKKAGLPQLKDRRLPLKHPADHWLPAAVWREIQRRARRLEWRESDELFFRKGFRNAFRFYRGERNRAPWLEALMYNRALYSTRRGEFRRRQFPREQKKYKWLQRVRKAFFPSRRSKYLSRRRWPRLRMYNQKLFYSLFNLPDRRAASRHFRKLNRRKGKRGGFAHSQTGLGDRLDVTLMHLNIAPTIFWARVVAPHGLLRINGKIVKDPAHRLSPGDFIQLEQERILRFRHFFKPVLRRHETRIQPKRYSSGAYPANFTYYPGLRSLVFNGLPKESELRRSNRLNARLFRWFKLDSV